MRRAIWHTARQPKPSLMATQFIRSAEPRSQRANNLFKNPPVDPLKDFEPLTALIKQPWVVVVDAKSPHKTLPELTAYLKEKEKTRRPIRRRQPPESSPVSCYKSIAGLETVQVNYKTIADSLNDLVVRLYRFCHGAMLRLRSGRQSRARCASPQISTAQRMKAMGDVPTMAERRRAGYRRDGVVGGSAPGWNAEADRRQTASLVHANAGYAGDGAVSQQHRHGRLKTTPAQTRALLEQEIKNWADCVKLAKIDPS